MTPAEEQLHAIAGSMIRSDGQQEAMKPGMLRPMEDFPCLRDQFAMAALTGYRSNAAFNEGSATLAQWAYEDADACLAERAKK